LFGLHYYNDETNTDEKWEDGMEQMREDGTEDRMETNES